VPVTFGGKKSTLVKLCHMTGHKVGVITYVQIFGSPHARNVGGPRCRKFGPISDNFSTLTSNILVTNWDIENQKQTWSTLIPAGFSKKKLVDFGH